MCSAASQLALPVLLAGLGSGAAGKKGFMVLGVRFVPEL